MNMDREWQRLLALYADKADEELLELHERRADLTELAQQVLEKTLKERGLEPETEGVPAAPTGRLGDVAIGDTEELEPGEISLITFRDGLEAAQAIAALREAEVPHRLTERKMRYIGGDSRDLLELVLDQQDAAQAREVLQRTLGLFPPPEGEDEYEEQDFLPLGQFTAKQAEIVGRELDARGIAHTTEQEPDAEPGDPVWIHVAAARSDEAFDLMEEIAETLPAEDE